jgi:large subunit ribosomal protein L24
MWSKRTSKPKSKKKVERKSLNIRTGDDVIVISGEGRSATPRKVLSVVASEGKVIVEGVNVMKDSQKNRNRGGRQAGINEQDFVEKPFPIDASNVALVDPQTKKRTRVRSKVVDGKRVRAAKSGETI